MIELKAHDRAVPSLEALVERLGPDAFASPKRSTVPLLDYWRVPERRLRDLGARLGVSWSDNTELHFEYEVPVQRGRGKSSYTDLMIIGNDVAVAIEAKFTESRYESVGTWLGRAQTTNRGTVLDGWLRAIEAVTEAAVGPATVWELPYQLIHRTASVCRMSQRKRFVVYHVFGDSPGEYYREDLGRLASAIAVRDRIMLFVVETAFRPTAAYAELVARWEAGERDMGDDVRNALIAGPLLEFAEPVAIPI